MISLRKQLTRAGIKSIDHAAITAAEATLRDQVTDSSLETDTKADGLTVVVKAGPTFEILAQNDFDDYTLSSPAISDGQIFIRTAKALYCIGKRALR